MDEKYNTGLLVGRFQPFHKGHLWLIKHSLQSVYSLMIGIGSANIYDRDNPFSFNDRKEMIDIVIKKEKIKDRIKKIIPLDDFYNDELWFQDTLRVTGGKFDIVIGNNEWVNGIFEKRGYTILRVGYYKRYLYEGEKIRRLLKYTYSRRPSQIGKPRTIVVRGKEEWVKRIPKYLAIMIKKSYLLHAIRYKFNDIALGGTFDHFHKGHKVLINTALKYGNHISIGITTSEMYKDKDFLSAIESFDERKKSVTEYLKKKKSIERITFFPLSNIYGSTKNDGTIEALIVSKLTYPNAIKINKLRAEKNLPELKIICIKDVKGNDGELISSERIRRGEIDREGHNFQFSIFPKRISSKFFGVNNFQKKQLKLPEYLREELRIPLGKVIQGNENELEKTAQKALHYINIMKSKPSMIIAVGDIIYTSLMKAGFVADLGIIDYRSRRKAIQDLHGLVADSHGYLRISAMYQLESKSVLNQAGTISKEAVDAIKKAINTFFEPSHPKGVQPQKSQTVVIDGEEDLLALPAILLVPLNSIVLYGQIDLGVVMVKVTEERKKEVINILSKFNG